MSWEAIEHPKGSCVLRHMGRSPDLVRVGTETVTDCLACITDACQRQRLKWKPWLCDKCRDPGTPRAEEPARLDGLEALAMLAP